jgi:HK97 family phage prohead protease
MIERRSYKLLEIRASDDGHAMRVKGHAAVFNEKSEEIFGFREIVLPGAFKNTIKNADVRALWNHDPNYVLGRNKNGTLMLREDKVGLVSEIDFPNTTFARDVFESIRRGDVDQMSFGFRTVTDSWRMEKGQTVRELIEVDLFDVSPVTFPAYPQTDLAARAEIRSFFNEKIEATKQGYHSVMERVLARRKRLEQIY